MKVDPVYILQNVIELKRRATDTAYFIYRKPCDRAPFVWESCHSFEQAKERAEWLAERDVDEYQVYDPRKGEIVFKA